MFSDTTKLITAIKDYIPEENWIEVIKNINFENLDDYNILNIVLKYCPVKDIEDFLYDSDFSLDDISEATNLLNHNDIDVFNDYSLEEFLDNIDELDDTGIQNLVKYLTTVDLTDTNEFDEDIILQILQSDLVKFSDACSFDKDFTYFGYEPWIGDIVTSNSKLSPDVVENLIMSLGKSKHYYYFNNTDMSYACDRPIYIAYYYGDILKHFDVYVSNGGGQMSCYIKEDFLDCFNSRRNEIKNYIIRNLGYTDEEIESEDKPLNLTWEEMH